MTWTYRAATRSIAAAIALGVAGAAATQAAGIQAASPGAIPRASHVTIVMMENKDLQGVVANPQARYINSALIPQGALLRNAHAVTHPSQPNYLALFSGSTQGVSDDRCPQTLTSANIASKLIAAGKTFAGYAESMPADGYSGCWSGSYARKHNPWVNFTNVPAGDNRVYRGFPSSPASLVWISPNLCNDMHDCDVKSGDAWLAAHLPAIVAWNASHDGILIVTWDEADPDRDGTNRIPTIVVGPMVRAGAVSTANVDHYSLLRTVEVMLGVGCIDRECARAPIGGIWK